MGTGGEGHQTACQCSGPTQSLHLTGFLFAGQIKPASHLTLTNSEHCPGGISQLPAKCGQCSGCSWKADDLAA